MIELTNLDCDGYTVVPDVLPGTTLAALQKEFAAPLTGGMGGLRNVFAAFPLTQTVAASDTLRGLLRAVTETPTPYRPVRGILFDKTDQPGANWKVPFHQDLSIAVRERPALPVTGYEIWSSKDGVPHVQPPVSVMERLITVRLHLDPCDAETGALRVLPGSHRLGRLAPDAVAQARREIGEAVPAVEAGGAFVFRPLLLHASSPMIRARARRRVLHIEYAPTDLTLPNGVNWHT
ncbi:MAG: phytanoyl-CoA dioxygenase family protein [Armatimonadetes bacterium]|nr:phytanoyl-CoA dioxygenase family protein [Armatimonadota bacterium]